MTRNTRCRSGSEKRRLNDDAVSTMTEYLSITAIVIAMFIVMTLVVNAALVEGPTNTLKYHAYVDIGNGVSTRMVELYAIAPQNGRINTTFDLPDDVANQDYWVEVLAEPAPDGKRSQLIMVTDGTTSSRIAIAGIGRTRGVTGKTSGAGQNVIYYNSEGV
ncbi:hypothetical protein [Methanovulcanius yangii]|uniref:hypothetical protein n=1 Tax=Methanovulcanius yangii TaxID=1789227 RepID=UPI0029C9FCEB|nr:hypothetical protein [Methanovulcanius yangii]